MVEAAEGERDDGTVLLHSNGIFSGDGGENLPDTHHGMAARFGEVSESNLRSLISVSGEEQLKVFPARDTQDKALLLSDGQQREAGGEWNGGVVQQRHHPTLLAEMAQILDQAIAEIDHGVGESMVP